MQHWRRIDTTEYEHLRAPFTIKRTRDGWQLIYNDALVVLYARTLESAKKNGQKIAARLGNGLADIADILDRIRVKAPPAATPRGFFYEPVWGLYLCTDCLNRLPIRAYWCPPVVFDGDPAAHCQGCGTYTKVDFGHYHDL